MSRIEDVFKRITGATGDPRPISALERYATERSPKVEENKVTSFLAHGPHPVEAKPQMRQKAAIPPAPAPPPPVPPIPNTHPSETVSAADESDSNERLIDIGQVFDYIGFLTRSLRRHWLLATSSFAFALGLTVAGTVLVPKTYHISTKLLAQRPSVITSLSNPGRPIPWDADAPTRAAAETVLRRDNLIDLIDKTNLVRNWKINREPILRLKDWFMAIATGYQQTDEDVSDGLIALLEKHMFVTGGPVGDGTVTIDLDWRNPEMGFRLVQVAQQSFIDARASAEKTMIDESIRILEEHAEELSGRISLTLAELERTQKSRTSASTARRVARAPTSRLSPTPAGDLAVPSLAAAMGLPGLSDTLDTDPEIGRLGATITAKKQDIARIETERDRQISQQRAQLDGLLQIYTREWPLVITAQRNLDALSQDPPQLITLRRDVERLERELKQRDDEAMDRQIKATLESRAATPPASQQLATRPTEPQAAPSPVEPATTSDASADFATLRLRSELNQYESVLERTASAKIEFTVSQRAFKYIYQVIRPAEVPKDPVKPNLKRILVAGFVASLMVGLFAAVGRDLLSNRILETWQVERQLGLPVLGALDTV